MGIIELLTDFIISEFRSNNVKLSSALFSQPFTSFYCHFEFNIILPILLFTLILYRVPVSLPVASFCSKCTNKTLCCRNSLLVNITIHMYYNNTPFEQLKYNMPTCTILISYSVKQHKHIPTWRCNFRPPVRPMNFPF